MDIKNTSNNSSESIEGVLYLILIVVFCYLLWNCKSIYYTVKYALGFPYNIAYNTSVDKEMINDNPAYFYWKNSTIYPPNAFSLNNLGNYFEMVEKNNDYLLCAAFYMYQRAAEGGYPIAEYNLGRIELKGACLLQPNVINGIALIHEASLGNVGFAKYIVGSFRFNNLYNSNSYTTASVGNIQKPPVLFNYIPPSFDAEIEYKNWLQNASFDDKAMYRYYLDHRDAFNEASCALQVLKAHNVI